MARKEQKTAEELEQEFKELIGMGDLVSQIQVWFYSLFDKGRTNICLATLYGKTQEIELTLFYHPELIDSIWDWGPRPSMTLLHCAAMALRNREMTVEFLLKNGVEATITDGDGATAMEYVLQDARDYRSRRLVKMFREHGAY